MNEIKTEQKKNDSKNCKNGYGNEVPVTETGFRFSTFAKVSAARKPIQDAMTLHLQ
jgi:hypothetical protein